jgi:hypothetical protein
MSAAPSGDLYATQLQVQRLEELVTNQQIALQELQQQNAFFTGGLPQAIEEQLQQAMKQRGSIGMDYANVTKFVMKQIAHAIQQIQEANQKLLAESIPSHTLQTLERRLLAKPTATLDLASLAARISHLESQKQQPQLQTHAQDPQNPAQIQELDAKLHHVETTLLAEIQRAYKTVYKPGDYAKPLSKLQATVERLDSDFQSFRSINFQESAMTMIKTANQNLREEFQTALETRASHDQLQRFEADVKRIEDFSKDVQTGFYHMKTRYEDFEKHLASLFHEGRWASLETKIQKALEAKEKQAQTQIQVALDASSEQVSTLLGMAESKIQKLEKEFNAELSAAALQRHLQQIRESIKETERTWFLDHAATTDRKTQEMAEKVQNTRTHILELASQVKEELEGAQLQKRFQVFQDALQDQEALLKQQEQKNKAAAEAARQQVALMEAVQSNIFDEMAKVKQLTTGLQKVWKEEQEVIKKQIATDTRERRAAMEQVNQELQQQIQLLQDQIRTAESSLQTTLEAQHEFTAEWKAEFVKAKTSLQDELANKTSASEDYLIGRVAELSASLQSTLQKTKEQQRELETLLSQENIDNLTTTVEKRVRQVHDEWSQRRTQEMGLRLGELQRQIEAQQTASLERQDEGWKQLDAANQAQRRNLESQIQRLLLETQSQTAVAIQEATSSLQQQQNAFEDLQSTLETLSQEYQEQISLEKGKERYAEFQTTLKNEVQTWTVSETSKIYYKFDEYRKEIMEAMRVTSQQQEALEAMFSQERLQELLQNLQTEMKKSYEEWKFVQTSVIRDSLGKSAKNYEEHMTKQFLQLTQGVNESVKNSIESLEESLLEYQENVSKYMDGILQKQQDIQQEEVKQLRKRVTESVSAMEERFGALKTRFDQTVQSWRDSTSQVQRANEEKLQKATEKLEEWLIRSEKEQSKKLGDLEKSHLTVKTSIEEQLRDSQTRVNAQMQTINQQLTVQNDAVLDTIKKITAEQNEQILKIDIAAKEYLAQTDAVLKSRNAAIQTMLQSHTKESMDKIQKTLHQHQETLVEQMTRLEEHTHDAEDILSGRIQEVTALQKASHQAEEQLQKAITELRGLHRALSESVRKVDGEAATQFLLLQDTVSLLRNGITISTQTLEEQLKRQAEKLQSQEDLVASRIQQLQLSLQVSKMELNEKLQTNNTFYTERLKQMSQTVQSEVGKHAAAAEEKLQRLLERRLAPEHLQDLIRKVASKLQFTQKPEQPLQIQQPVLTRTFYTAIFGASLEDADTLAPFESIPGWDAVCFTNLPLPSTEGWQIIQVPYDGTQYALEAKRYKWLSHKFLLDYDVVVWVDGYLVPNKTQAPLLDSWLEIAARHDTPLVHRAHETRDCIYEECAAVIRYKKDTEENVAKVRVELEKVQMPRSWGLFDTNVMARFHKKAVVQRLSEEIFEQLETTSMRDQLAVSLVYYKNKFDDFKVNSLLHAFQKVGRHVNHIV